VVWAAAAAPPLVWMAQGVIGWYLTGRACRSAGALSLGAARVAIVAITALAMAASVTVLIAVLRGRWPRRAPDEAQLPAAAAERRRFVAALAVVASITLTLGLALAVLPAIVLHGCGGAG
jgi:hypothetical protein